MQIIKGYTTIILGISIFSSMLVHAVRFINVTQTLIYFSVFYKKGNSVIPQIKPIYSAPPNGDYFVHSNTFDIKNQKLKISIFKWPPQKCVEFTRDELIGLGVGVGVGTAVLGAGVGALAAGEAGAGVAVAGAGATEAGVVAGEAGAAGVTASVVPILGEEGEVITFSLVVNSNVTGGFGTLAEAQAAAAEIGGTAPAAVSGVTVAQGATAGSGLGAIGGVFAGKGLCKAEHYPRTVLFSFDMADMTQKKYDTKKLLQVDHANTGLYLGDNVDAGEIHFLFYNLHGFDPRYAAYGKPEGHGAIKARRINSQTYDNRKPIADVLRNYLRFVEYVDHLR